MHNLFEANPLFSKCSHLLSFSFLISIAFIARSNCGLRAVDIELIIWVLIRFYLNVLTLCLNCVVTQMMKGSPSLKISGITQFSESKVRLPSQLTMMPMRLLFQVYRNNPIGGDHIRHLLLDGPYDLRVAAASALDRWMFLMGQLVCWRFIYTEESRRIFSSCAYPTQYFSRSRVASTIFKCV